MNLGSNSYDIHMYRNALHDIGKLVNVNRKVLIITDTGVPAKYAEIVKKQCKEGYISVVEQGEEAKSFPVFQKLCEDLLTYNFSRKDCIIAIGGGVVGDLSGFVAASYMRGIDFVQIPTTTLSQIDSSIGGKVAINLNGVKNVIGAFYQPKAVIIDPETLMTLPERHYYNGLIEALKAGLIYDKHLFEHFEKANLDDQLEDIIYAALCVKKDVVEKDERELGLRKILNFGHTIGHAIESYYHLSQYYHGECVAMGMLYFIEDENLKQRVLQIYQKLNITPDAPYDADHVFEILKRDKKASGDMVTVVKVREPGTAILEDCKLNDVRKRLKG